MMRSWPCLAVALALGGGSARAELPVEHVTVEQMPQGRGHLLFVLDFGMAHGVDGKVHVIDGDGFRIVGQLSNGFFGDFLVSADGGTLYNATTFFARGDHGTPTDVLEYYDPKTLLPTAEVLLPTKRAQSNSLPSLMAESAGGAYVFVQNATPATSVSVVDVKARKVLGEIPNAGCYGIYPSSTTAGRFSSLCGDGAVLTVDFAADGHETGRHRSGVFFDPEADPLFSLGVAGNAGKTVFLSFLGNVHVIDVSGEVATQEAPWSILANVAGATGWRPGGWQMTAYSQSTGMLYVGMHPDGKEGSHKDPAREIWKIDLGAKKVVARGKSDGAVCLQVSREARPVLFTESGETGALARYDGDTLAKLGEAHFHVLEGGGPIWVQ